MALAFFLVRAKANKSRVFSTNFESGSRHPRYYPRLKVLKPKTIRKRADSPLETEQGA
jgi:hypothetical protein